MITMVAQTKTEAIQKRLLCSLCTDDILSREAVHTKDGEAGYVNCMGIMHACQRACLFPYTTLVNLAKFSYNYH